MKCCIALDKTFFLFLHKNVCCGYSLELHVIAIDNKESQYFSYFSTKKFIVGLCEAFLMSTHNVNVCFCSKIRKTSTFFALKKCPT